MGRHKRGVYMTDQEMLERLAQAARAVINSDSSKGLYYRRFNPPAWARFLDALQQAEAHIGLPRIVKSG
jgi:hypothetical protein